MSVPTRPSGTALSEGPCATGAVVLRARWSWSIDPALRGRVAEAVSDLADTSVLAEAERRSGEREGGAARMTTARRVETDGLSERPMR